MQVTEPSFPIFSIFPMRLTRPELEEALLALEASIPTIKTLTRPESRLATFNADAYMIQSAASRDDVEYARHQLRRMMVTSGL
jgi:hypothetical protein